jgi:hypothetical protein
VLWGYFALAGFDAMSDIQAQDVPGYPNSAQRNYYLIFPNVMALVSAGLVLTTWSAKRRSLSDGLALLLLGIWLAYLFPYGGGV